MMNADNGAL